MKKNNFIAFLGLLFAIAAIFVGFVVTNAQSVAERDSQGIADENSIAGSISSWESYTNDKYGFSLQHPAGSSWFKRDNSERGEMVASHVKNKNNRGPHAIYPGDIKISTYMRNNEQELSVSDWLDTLPGASTFDEVTNSKEEILVGDRNGLRINMTDGFGRDIETVFLPVGYGKILEVDLLPANSETLEVFNQVINSLEFTHSRGLIRLTN